MYGIQINADDVVFCLLAYSYDKTEPFKKKTSFKDTVSATTLHGAIGTDGADGRNRKQQDSVGYAKLH
jgi:hypothetical protein